VDSLHLKYKQCILISGTCVSDFDNAEEHPLLEVDCTDLCVAHLRPDFVDDIYFPSSEDEYFDDHDDLCDWGNHILDCI
jgi:hypothetical protein